MVATLGVTGSAWQPPGPPYPPGALPIATGERRTVYYQYGLGVLDATRRGMPELEPYLVVTPSNQHAVEQLALGRVRLAFSRADVADNLPPGEAASLSALARLYDDYLHLAVRHDSPINDLTDLRGKRVSIGLDGSGTQRTVLDLLGVAGLTRADFAKHELGVADSGHQLQAGQIDAFFFFGGIPTEAFGRLKWLGPELRLVDLARWAPVLRQKHGDFYTPSPIPNSVYGMAPITTVAVPNYLLVSTSMDPDLAYALTAILFTQRKTVAGVHGAERLDRRVAINTGAVPLHPGAARYYRDTKI